MGGITNGGTSGTKLLRQIPKIKGARVAEGADAAFNTAADALDKLPGQLKKVKSGEGADVLGGTDSTEGETASKKRKTQPTGGGNSATAGGALGY